MNSSIPSTTCSSPNNDSVEKVIKNDSIRYRRKGYGLFMAILIASSYFYLMPKILASIWPTLDTKGEITMFYFFVSIGLHSLVFGMSNLIMYAIYVTKLPFFERYKIMNKPWPWEQDAEKWNTVFKNTIKNIAVSHLILAPIMIYLDTVVGLKFRFDMDSFPTYQEILPQIVFFMICDDFFFYWIHRILHLKQVYSIIHKKHHEYNITVSIAAEYAHPLEFVFSNLLPFAMGPKILGSQVHFATHLLWLIIRSMETVDGHSGYEFSWSPYRLLPLSGSSIYHNFHHSNNVGNFGSFFTYWDTLCGTNKAYYKYLSKKEKETVLSQLRDEYEKLKAKIDADPNQKLAKLSELNADQSSQLSDTKLKNE